MTASPLSPHISHVVALGSQKQMVWVHAPAVVASVQNATSVVAPKVWDFAEVQLVANPMGSALKLVKRHLTIPGRHRRQLPRPAFVRPFLLDVSPELGADVLRRWQNPVSGGTTRRGAKTARARPLNVVPTANAECLSTHFARYKAAAKATRLGAATSRAQVARCLPFAKHRAANSARRVAVFDWWCHAKCIPNAAFDDNLIAFGFPLNEQEPQQ